MRKLLNLYVISILFLASAIASANGQTALDKCLNTPSNLTRDCIAKFVPHKTIDKCYQVSEKIYSAHSKENVKNYCFYSISEFPTLNTCVTAAKKFYIAENKDQALFECVRQFSSTISEKSCLSVAKNMTYAEKKNYLENHCRNM